MSNVQGDRIDSTTEEEADKAKLEAERAEAEKAERARLEAERVEKERQEAERGEEERKQEAERVEEERLEAARIEKEKKEREEAEKKAKEQRKKRTMDNLVGQFTYGDQSTRGARWTIWLERFRLQCKQNKAEEEDDKKSLFLLLLGQEAFALYTAKKKPDGTDKIEEIIAFMTKEFVTQKSEYTEVLTFRQANRRDGESVNEYASRLRCLALDCGYGASVEKEIERQFVMGCRMPEVQAKCARTNGLDLNKVLEYAVGYERNIQNLTALQAPMERRGDRESIIHYTAQKPSSGGRSEGYRSHNQSRVNGTNNRERDCGYCGREAHLDRSRCPARNVECRKCGKKNHFAKVCRNKSEAPTHQGTGGQQRSHGQQARGSTNIRQIFTDPNGSFAEERSEPTQSDSFLVSAEDYAEYIRYKAASRMEFCTITRSSKSISAVNGEEEVPRIEANINGRVVSCLIDTGSPVNVIDEETFNQLARPKPELERCSTDFYGFASEKPISVLGQFTASIQVRGRSVQAEVVVVKGKQERLISYKTALELRIVAIINSVAGNAKSEADELAEKFPKLFSDKLGCITGVQVGRGRVSKAMQATTATYSVSFEGCSRG